MDEKEQTIEEIVRLAREAGKKSIIIVEAPSTIKYELKKKANTDLILFLSKYPEFKKNLSKGENQDITTWFKYIKDILVFCCEKPNLEIVNHELMIKGTDAEIPPDDYNLLMAEAQNMLFPQGRNPEVVDSFLADDNRGVDSGDVGADWDIANDDNGTPA